MYRVQKRKWFNKMYSDEGVVGLRDWLHAKTVPTDDLEETNSVNIKEAA